MYAILEVTKEIILSKASLYPSLSKVLQENDSPEVIEACLELLATLSETGIYI